MMKPIVCVARLGITGYLQGTSSFAHGSYKRGQEHYQRSVRYTRDFQISRLHPRDGVRLSRGVEQTGSSKFTTPKQGRIERGKKTILRE